MALDENSIKIYLKYRLKFNLNFDPNLCLEFDLKFDLKFELKIDLKPELTIKNSALEDSLGSDFMRDLLNDCLPDCLQDCLHDSIFPRGKHSYRLCIFIGQWVEHNYQAMIRLLSELERLFSVGPEINQTFVRQGLCIDIDTFPGYNFVEQ